MPHMNITEQDCSPAIVPAMQFPIIGTPEHLTAIIGQESVCVSETYDGVSTVEISCVADGRDDIVIGRLPSDALTSAIRAILTHGIPSYQLRTVSGIRTTQGSLIGSLKLIAEPELHLIVDVPSCALSHTRLAIDPVSFLPYL